MLFFNLVTEISIHSICSIVQFHSDIPVWWHWFGTRNNGGNVCLRKEKNDGMVKRDVLEMSFTWPERVSGGNRAYHKRKSIALTGWVTVWADGKQNQDWWIRFWVSGFETWANSQRAQVNSIWRLGRKWKESRS